jgi:hypothetical protein
MCLRARCQVALSGKKNVLRVPKWRDPVNEPPEVTGEKESTIVYYRTMKNKSKHPEQGPKYKE